MTKINRTVTLFVTASTSKPFYEHATDVRDAIKDLQDKTSDGSGVEPAVSVIPPVTDPTHGHNELADVDAFHLKFRIPTPATPALLNREAFKFRKAFLEEEVREFAEGHEEGDLRKAVDALVDLVYVALGTILMMGCKKVWWSVWARVQYKNMQKVRAASAAESKRGSALDVCKPVGWTPPDHTPDFGELPHRTFEPSEAVLDTDNREVVAILTDADADDEGGED